MASKGNVRVSILGDASDLKRATDQAGGMLSRLSRDGGKHLDGLKSAALGLGAAIGVRGLVGELRGAYDAYTETFKVQKQTEAVLTSTRHAANLTAKQISDLATAVSNKTGIDDEAIQSSENLLLTFKNVRNEAGRGNDVFSQTTRLATDMSVALGKSGASSAMMLGKALNDPTAGMSKLTRAGVTFTDQQKKQVAALQKSGNMLGAQKIILREVASEFGGSAEKAATPMAKLKVTLGNLQEDIGSKLFPIAQKAAAALLEVINQMQRGQGIGGKLRSAVEAVGTGIGKLVRWVRDLVSGFKDGETRATAIVGALAGLAGALAAAKAISTLSTAFKILRTVLLANPLFLIAAALAALGAALLVAYRKNEEFRAHVQAAWAWIKTNVGPAFAQVKQTIGNALAAIQTWVVAHKAQIIGAFQAVVSFLRATVPPAFQAIKQIVSTVFAFLKANGPAAFQAVKTAVVTAFTAIKTAISAAVQFITGWINKHRADIVAFGQAWKNIAAAVTAVVKVLAAAIKIAFEHVLAPAIEFAWAVVKRALPGILQIIQGVLRVISGVIKVFIGVFTGDWGKAWGGLKDIASGALKQVGGVIRAGTAPLREIAARLGGAIVDGIKSGLGKIGDVVSGAISAVKSAFGAVGGFASSVGDSLRNWINDNTLFGDAINIGPIHTRIPALATGGIIVPGSDKRDGTPILASGGETVFTYSGQRILNLVGAAAGVPNLVNYALANQMPHFANGGIVGNAYGQGYQVGVQGGSLSSFISDVISKSLTGEPHKRKSSTRAGGGSAPGGAPAAVRAMVSRANEIAGRHLPYLYGGGHGAFSTKLAGYDCSGYVSNILGPGVLPSTMAVRQPLQGALLSGPGKWVTVGIRGTSGQNAHTMVKIGNAYYESGGHHGPARVGGWDGSFDMYHPRGYRTGGRVPKLIRELSTAGRTSVKGILRSLAQALASESTSQSELFAAQSAISAAMTRLRAGGVSKTENPGLKGLRGGLSLVQGEQGRRIGADVGGIDTLTAQISDAADILDLEQKVGDPGYASPDSAAGIQQKAAAQTKALGQLKAKRKQLLKTLATAKKTKNKGLVKNVKAAIGGLDKTILQQRAAIIDTQTSAPAGPTHDDYLSSNASVAALTAGLDDDRAVAADTLNTRQQQYASAMAGGDPRVIKEAADNLKAAADNLASIDEAIKQQAYSSNDAKQSLDKLAEAQADANQDPQAKADAQKRELADLEERKKLDEANLEEAKRTNDPAKIAEAADRETQTIQAINDLNQNLSQANALSQQRIELEQTIADNQGKLLAIAGQGDQILNAVLAAVDGGIGGRVGLGSQSPSFAGQLARY